MTDAKIMKTGDGKSRQMAFVGYKTEEDATKALEYFNNTFVDTSKISVEYARAVKSTTLPRPWSRHSEGSSAHARSNAPAPDPDAPEPPDPDRFVGVRELKKMKNARKHAAERELEAMLAADPKLAEFGSPWRPGRSRRSGTTRMSPRLASAGDGDGDLHARLRDEKPAFEDDGSTTTRTTRTWTTTRAKSGRRRASNVSRRETPRKRCPIGGGADDGPRVTASTSATRATSPRRATRARATRTIGVDALAADDGVSDMDYLKKRAGAFSESESDEDEDASDGASEEEDASEEEEEEAETSRDVEKKPASVKAACEKRLEGSAGGDRGGHGGHRGDGPGVCSEPPVHRDRGGSRGVLFALRPAHRRARHRGQDDAAKQGSGVRDVRALPENGVAAMEALDGTIFQGRLIHLAPGDL